MWTGLGKEKKNRLPNYIQNFINSVCIQYGINDYYIHRKNVIKTKLMRF